MLGIEKKSSASSLRIGARFPALLDALFRALDEDGDGRINVEACMAGTVGCACRSRVKGQDDTQV